MATDNDKVGKAVSALRQGRIVIIYDGDEREGEADMVIGARFTTPKTIETLRRRGGGLICAAIGKKDADGIGLPFFVDLLEKDGRDMKSIACRRTAYGDKPAFSLPVNHREVYTGITDNDRSLTIRKLDEVICSRPEEFTAEFYSPGHVFLLIGSGLRRRCGHTELSLELGGRAGLRVMVLCEMLDRGKALSKKKAKAYARKNKLQFLEGAELR